jgi:hypothetical protein
VGGNPLFGLCLTRERCAELSIFFFEFEELERLILFIGPFESNNLFLWAVFNDSSSSVSS